MFKETVEAGERAVADIEEILEESGDEGWTMAAVDIITLDSLLEYIKELKIEVQG